MATQSSPTDKAVLLPYLQSGPRRAQVRRFATLCRVVVGATVLATTVLALTRLSVTPYSLLTPHSQATAGPGTPLAVQLDEADFDWFALKPSVDIEWAPCYSGLGEQCARVLLPLDYDTPDGPQTAIALRVIPAADKKNYKGTLFVNPGGPGGSGTGFIGRAGRNISRIVGPEYDVLGFDPRGIGASTPSARCFETDSQRKLWDLQEDRRLLNLTDGSVDVYRAREKLVAARCEEKIGGEWGIAKFAGTHLVARDMLEIAQKLGQEKLQYWGFSYGTILGQYFAAMFPDKVGRVIIDGVFDAYSYRANIWETSLVDTDAVINSFFHFCHEAGPDKCKLWETSPSQIRTRYLNVLRAVETEPLAIPLADPPLVLTRKHLHAQIFGAAYKPLAGFGLVADTIAAIESNNLTALTALAPKIVDPTECSCAAPNQPWLAGSEAMRAVECGDGDEQPFDPQAFEEFYDRSLALSQLATPIWAVNYLSCAEWRVRPKTRWMGPFEAEETANPLLLISPRYDPVCPLADAQAVHSRFGGAGLLVQESYGHCSLSAPSLCTARHVRAYMANGTVPAPGTVCEVDELPFIGRTNASNARVESREDAELLDAMRGLSQALPVSNWR